MNTVLYWRAGSTEKNEVDDEVKYILSGHFWGQSGDFVSPEALLDVKDKYYLGYLANEKEIIGARKLIEAIDKYKSIVIWIGEKKINEN